MYYFIINSHSRSGYGGQIWEIIQEELNRKKIPYEYYITQYEKHAVRLANLLEMKHTVCTLVVVGGDGTVNEVLDGIRHPQNITLGYIPTGSGNDFARGMGIPTDPGKALQLILGEHTDANMDVGLVEAGRSTRRFGVSAGLGFDAAICHEALSSSIKDTLNHLGLGKLTYVGIALKQLLLYRPCKATVRVDGHQVFHFPRLFFMAVMNQPYEGGGLKLAPGARTQDGEFQVCIVGNLSKPTILFMLPTAFWGKHTRFRGIHMLSCKKIEIHAERRLPVHSDGESFGYARTLSFSILEEQIRVIAPAGSPSIRKV